jgi:hypothetical protein
MPKQQPGPSATQLRGEDGVCETVLVDGVRINKHEYDEEEMGAAKPDKHSPVPSAGAAQSRARSKKAQAEDQDFESMTVEELQKHLDKEGIEYSSDDRKDDLIKHAKKGK